MRRCRIEPRDSWIDRINQSGVVMKHDGSGKVWNERCCIQITLAEAESICTQAELIYDEIAELTDYVIERCHLSDLKLTREEKGVIADSWEMSDYLPTLFTRVDGVIDATNTFQFRGIASGLTDGLLEAAVAQWDWLQESSGWASQSNTISERLIEAWREYRLTDRMIHVVYDAADRYSTNLAEYLWDSALSAGARAVPVAHSDLRVEPASKKIIDCQGREIDVLIRCGNFSPTSDGSLWTLTSHNDVCLVEPHWKRLWENPEWISLYAKQFRGDSVDGKLQALRRCEKSELVCSVWIVAGKASGLGFSRVGRGAEEFIPHMLLVD